MIWNAKGIDPSPRAREPSHKPTSDWDFEEVLSLFKFFSLRIEFPSFCLSFVEFPSHCWLLRSLEFDFPFILLFSASWFWWDWMEYWISVGWRHVITKRQNFMHIGLIPESISAQYKCMRALQHAEHHILEGEIRRHVEFLCLCDRTLSGLPSFDACYFQLSSTGLRRTMYRNGAIVAGLEFKICDNHFSLNNTDLL